MDHLIKSVEQSLSCENYLSALYLSLTLPDICARIDSDKDKTSKIKYIAWFDEYLAKTYKHKIGDNKEEHVFLTGSDLYALRCAVLHEGSLNIVGQRAQQIHEKIFFTIGHPHLRQINSILQLDLPSFCREICAAVSNWLEANRDKPEANNKLQDMLSIFSEKCFSTNDL